MSWKQPIDTNIFSIEGCTAFERSVWFEIIMRAANEPRVERFYHGNKNIAVELNRGQMIFRVSQFALEQGVDRKRVRNAIEFLQKWYNEMDIETRPFGLLITIDSYDELVKMNSETHNERTAKGQRKDSERSTSNKSDKSDKSEKIYTAKFDETYFTSRELYAKICKSTPFDNYEITYNAFKDYYPKIKDYSASTGKIYKNFEATIRNWLRNDISKKRYSRFLDEDHKQQFISFNHL